MTHLPVVHSLLDTGTLAGIIERRYDIGRIAAVQLYRSYVNDVYRVETSRGTTFFLKIARQAWRTPEHVAWDVALQQHLHQHHVSVSEPMVQRDGEAVCVLDAPEGARAAVLYAETQGIKPQPPFTPEIYETVQWSGLWRTTPQIVAERIERLRVWARRIGAASA